MDRQMDGQMYRRTYGNSPLCPTGHRPFGAAALLLFYSSANHLSWASGTADHVRSLDDLFFFVIFRFSPMQL